MNLDQALNASVTQIGDAYGSIVDEARAELARMGIRVTDDADLDRPRFKTGEFYEGQIPENLDSLSNDELTEIMSLHAEWTRYINGAISEAQARRVVAQQKEKAVRASITAERGKDKYESDRRYINVAAELTYAEVMLTYLEAIKSTATNDYRVISRVITLRGQDADIQGRVANVQRGW